MNDSVLDKNLVLSLNGNWERIGWKTPRQAIIAMCGGDGGTAPALGLSVTVDENGKLVEAIPLAWEEWIKLPVRDCDLSISTRSGAIRCPTLVIAPNYKKMPFKSPKLSKEGILERDGLVCQYTGKKLSRAQLNVDHVIPSSRGGLNTWENMVASDKLLNFTKGDKFNHEVGLTLIRKPSKPKDMPISFTIREAKRPEHVPFIVK